MGNEVSCVWEKHRHAHGKWGIMRMGQASGWHGKPNDMRTSRQRHSLHVLVKALLPDYPGSRVVGHRNLSSDLDGDGRVTPKNG
jgi:hypothetical protein